MAEILFDGGLSTAELIALDCIMEDLPKESKERFIAEYIDEDPDEWKEYLAHRERMGYPKL